MVRLVDVGKPVDLDKLSFWSHRVVNLGFAAHVRFGERNLEWAADLDYLRRYLMVLEGRYKLYSLASLTTA